MDGGRGGREALREEEVGKDLIIPRKGTRHKGPKGPAVKYRLCACHFEFENSTSVATGGVHQKKICIHTVSIDFIER